MVVVLHAHLGSAVGQSRKSLIRRCRLVGPGRDDESSINPHPNSVVGSGGKCRGPGREIENASPSAGEVVDKTIPWSAQAPVVIDARLAGSERWRTAERSVVVVLGEILTTRARNGRDCEGQSIRNSSVRLGDGAV